MATNNASPEDAGAAGKNFDKNITTKFLSKLYGEEFPGFLTIWTPDKRCSFHRNVQEAVGKVQTFLHQNVYFGIGLRREQLGEFERGESKDVIVIPGFWMDIDIKGPNHKQTKLPATQDEALQLARSFPLRPSMIIFSGGGIYPLWLFKEFWLFESEEERNRAQQFSRRLQSFLIKEAAAKGWILDNTSDLARVLRLPGSYNLKQSDKPVLVKIIEDNPERYSPSDFEQYLPVDDHDHDGDQQHRESASEFSPADIEGIVKGCPWLCHCRDDAQSLTEPEWYSMLSIVGRCIDGEKTAQQWSSAYPGYSSAATSAKLKHALADGGPRTCENISLNGGAGYCGKCQHRGKITSPILLGIIEREKSIKEVIESAGLNTLTESSTTDQIIAHLRTLAVQSKGFDKLFIAGIREAAIRILKEIGNKSPAAMVDAALESTKDTEEDSGIKFAEYTIFEEAVDGAALLDEMVQLIKTYIHLPKHAAEAEALWILHAHTIEAFSISPFLALTSPEKRCGKTANLELIGGTVPRPLFAANITAAALFRVVHQYTPTLLIDEADTFLSGSDELRGILNSGHRKRSAFVIRCVGDDSEPQQFCTWSPKVIARIGDLPDTLADRSIIIRMIRKSSSDLVKPLRLDSIEAELQGLCRKAARWTADHFNLLRSADPVMPQGLNDRAADCWRPLIAIADEAGGSWPKLARATAQALSGVGSEEQLSIRVQLLVDIKQIFESRKVESIASSNLAAALADMENRKWGEWKKGKPITPIQMAAQLRHFKIISHQIWNSGLNHRGYDLEDFRDAFLRYVPTNQPLATDAHAESPESPPSNPLDPLDPNNDAGPELILDPLEDDTSSDPKTTVSNRKQTILAGLATQNPLFPENPVCRQAEASPGGGDWLKETSMRLQEIRKRHEEEGTL